MGRSYLLSPRLIEQSVLTASGSVGSSVVANLQTTDPRDVWRSPNATPHVIINTSAVTMDRTVDTLALGYFLPNGIAMDAGLITVRIRGAASEAALTSGPAYDATVGISLANVYPYRRVHWAHKLPAARTDVYWRLDFTVTGGVLVEAGRLLMGKRVQPGRPVRGQWSGGGSEPLAATRSMFGSQKRRPMGGVTRSTSAVFHDLSLAELALITELLEQRGTARDFLLVKDEDETAYPLLVTHLGGLTGQLQYSNTFSKRFSYAISMEEFAPLEMT